MTDDEIMTMAFQIKAEAEKSAKKTRLKRLEAAIKQLADAKGRHNTAIAYAKLMEEFQNAE